MTEGQRFGKFNIKTDSNGDRLIWEYLPTGETDELDASGASLKRNPPPFGSVDTERLYNASDILEIGPTDGLIHRRDPSSSPTPVQDAIDNVASAGGGQVLLPPGNISEGGTLTAKDFVHVRGQGFTGGNATNINIAATGGVDGIDVVAGGAVGGSLMDFRVTNSDGLGAGAGHGLHINNSLSRFDVSLRFDDWDNNVVDWQGGGAVNRFHRLDMVNCDAGADIALMNLAAPGAMTWFGTLRLAADDTASSTDSPVFDMDGGGDVMIDQMNLGGTVARAIFRTGGKSLQIGAINWEPDAPNATPDRVVFNGEDSGPLRVGTLRVNGTADNAYFLNQGSAYLGIVHVDGTLNNDKVRINVDVSTPVIYEGNSADVNNASGGTLTQPVACLADLTTVS